MDILIDFDGTCVTHDFPIVGKDIGAVPVLKNLIDNGHRLILFTMRSDMDSIESKDYGGDVHGVPGKYLTDAVNWFRENDIPLYGIQNNPTQHEWTDSPKAYGQLIIDDTGLGIPLKLDHNISNRPFVDWSTVEYILYDKNILKTPRQ